MNRPIKALALAAFVLAGVVGATTAQASAANFTIDFNMKNTDTHSLSMIRTSSLPSRITGLSAPAATISPGNYDPNTGNATYSDQLPALNNSVSADVTYAQASDGVSNPCTFTITVKRDSNSQPFLVTFSNHGVSRCIVPGPARSSSGAFSGTFTLSWAT
jgi:hypothetical protein